MDQDHMIRVEDLVEDSVVANPEAKEFVMWSLNCPDELAWRSWIDAQGVDGSLKTPPFWL